MDVNKNEKKHFRCRHCGMTFDTDEYEEYICVTKSGVKYRTWKAVCSVCHKPMWWPLVVETLWNGCRKES